MCLNVLDGALYLGFHFTGGLLEGLQVADSGQEEEARHHWGWC
jgi:hypothetical protein